MSGRITPEELQKIISFVEGDDATAMEDGTLNKFFSLSMAIQKKLAETALKTERRNFMLERRLDRFKKKEQEAADEGNFAESGLDSVDVALALLHCLQQLKTYQLSKNMLIYILFTMYGSWLASKKERLFAEHPVATSWGPQFWRVSKRIENVKASVPQEAFNNLASQNPAVAAFCRNAAKKYYDWREYDLKEILMKCPPYVNALPEKNNGKWGKEINDSDIFVWKNNAK